MNANRQPRSTPNQRSGYTIDEDGLVNNYAIEPEMYVNQPGDRRQKTKRASIDSVTEAASTGSSSQRTENDQA